MKHYIISNIISSYSRAICYIFDKNYDNLSFPKLEQFLISFLNTSQHTEIEIDLNALIEFILMMLFAYVRNLKTKTNDSLVCKVY